MFDTAISYCRNDAILHYSLQ